MPPTSRLDYLPPLVTEAVEILGSPVRVAVIGSLISDGPATTTELAYRLRVRRGLLQIHMQMLEDRGVVHPTPPRTEPGRLQRTFHLDTARVGGLRDALVATITPSADR